MTFSSLISGTVPHHNKHRGEGPVNRFVLHHRVNTNVYDARLESAGTNVSANYLIYSDGTIKGQVPEEYRPWTTGPTGDAGSITAETQNTSLAPNYTVSDKAAEAIAQLLADLSNRYGWGELKRGTNVRVHQDFAATACPGPDLLRRLPNIIARANQLRKGSTPAPKEKAGDFVGKQIVLAEKWWNYKNAADAAKLVNKVRLLPAGTYNVTKTASGSVHLANVNGKHSGWVHGSVLNGRTPAGSAQRTHTVVKGDTLWAIAKKYGTTVAKIRKANGISGSLIKPGWVLKV